MPTFDEIAEDFLSIANGQVWCNVTTLDTKNRPRSRVLHPIWEHNIGWIATGRQSLKAKHLAHNPYVSLSYMKDPLKPLYVECRAEWIDDKDEMRRIWDLFANTPPPLSYDPTPFFGSVDSSGFGVLKLTPWRIELADLFGTPRVWQA